MKEIEVKNLTFSYDETGETLKDVKFRLIKFEHELTIFDISQTISVLNEDKSK